MSPNIRHRRNLPERRRVAHSSSRHFENPTSKMLLYLDVSDYGMVIQRTELLYVQVPCMWVRETDCGSERS